jgi:hypothetical protein
MVRGVIAMIENLFMKAKRKHLKLQVWKKRLQKLLELHLPSLSPGMECSLQVFWGPFYNGAVHVDHRFKKVKMIVQIPYDGYVTTEEQQLLSRFSLSKKELPYFILFHELSHLLDIMPFIHTSDYGSLKAYLAEHKQMARATANYKDLSFEERADLFAYRMILKMDRLAS